MSSNQLFGVERDVALDLWPLIESGRELATIERLERWEGDESDLRVAASLYERAGEGANAAALLRELPAQEVRP